MQVSPTASYRGVRLDTKIAVQDEGSVEDKVVTGRWVVIPGSGAGEVSGLRGTGDAGERAVAHLDHRFQ